jgi:hypothetical protein
MSQIDEREIKRRFKAISQYELSPEVAARDLERTRKRLTEQTSGQQTRQQKIWRIIMRNRMVKLGAAAVIIIIIVLTSIRQFESSSVAWGEVVRKLEDIHAYSFRKRRLETTDPQKGFEPGSETRVYYSVEHGEWTESFRDGHLNTRTYALLKEKEFIGIVPRAKIYDRRSLSEASIRQLRQMMPRQVVTRFFEADYKALGAEIIDGEKVYGVEIHDPDVLSSPAPPVEDFVARLWVDVKTKLPVRLELEFIADGKMYTRMVFDQFQWNVQLNAGDFEPNIPSDYTMGTHSDK